MPEEFQPISVCIPVYNGGAFVAEAVKSVLAQDYPCFEVCVCENVSSDDTAGILRELEKGSDPRLRVSYEQEHIHLAANLNRAARMGVHPWVLVLSADDRMRPEALRSLNEEIARYPDADLFIGKASYLTDGGNRKLGRADYRHEPGPVPDFEEFVVGNSFPVNINATLLRRDLAVFREDCGVVCDLNLMIELGQARKNAILVDQELIDYREHAEATSSNRIKMWSESLEVYLDHLPGTTRPDLYRRRIFRMLFWCGLYLKENSDVERARSMIERAAPSLSFFQRRALGAVLRLPLSLDHFDQLRKLRRNLIS